MKWAQALESSEVRSGRKNAGAPKVVDYYTAYFDNAHGGFGFESDIDELKIVIYIGDKEPTDELKEEKIELLVPPVVDGQISPLFRTPCTTKWAKTGPASDRAFFCLQNGNLRGLSEDSLGHMTFKQTLEVNHDPDNEDDDYGGRELDNSWIEWQAVAGKQCKLTRFYLSSFQLCVQTAIFIIVDEGSRYLTQVHLYYAYREYSYDP